MSLEHDETALRAALDAVDRIRRRMLIGGWLAVAITLGAYAWQAHVANTSNDLERVVMASVLALTCLIASGMYSVSIVVVRMTKRILRAIAVLADTRT